MTKRPNQVPSEPSLALAEILEGPEPVGPARDMAFADTVHLGEIDGLDSGRGPGSIPPLSRPLFAVLRDHEAGAQSQCMTPLAFPMYDEHTGSGSLSRKLDAKVARMRRRVVRAKELVADARGAWSSFAWEKSDLVVAATIGFVVFLAVSALGMSLARSNGTADLGGESSVRVFEPDAPTARADVVHAKHARLREPRR